MAEEEEEDEDKDAGQEGRRDMIVDTGDTADAVVGTKAGCERRYGKRKGEEEGEEGYAIAEKKKKKEEEEEQVWLCCKWVRLRSRVKKREAGQQSMTKRTLLQTSMKEEEEEEGEAWAHASSTTMTTTMRMSTAAAAA